MGYFSLSKLSVVRAYRRKLKRSVRSRVSRAMAIPSPSPDLCRQQCGFPLRPLAALAAGGTGTSFLRLVVRVRVFLLWCAIGVVGVAPERINLPHLYSHTGDDLHGGISEVMATCVVWSFRLVAWSSRRSLDLARSVSWCVADLCWWLGRVVSLERGCLSEGGESVVLPGLRRWETMGLGPRQHGDVPLSTCHIDICLATCSRFVHRLTKPRWQ
jgi:hypothetical protein